MNVLATVKKLVSNLTFVITLGIVIGFLTEGYPSEYLSDISTVLLVIAMTLSLSHLSIRNIDIRLETKNFLISLLLCYGMLSTVAILIGISFFRQPDIQNGFVVIAAVPPAVMIIPITRILNGNIKLSLFSLSLLYLISIILTPLVILLFSNANIPMVELFKSIILYIVTPLLVSRLVKKTRFPSEISTIIINLCFLLIIIGMIGGNKHFIFSNMKIMPFLSLALFIRTFGTGGITLWAANKLHVPKDDQIPFALFASVKNEGLAMIFALSMFCCAATLPAVLSMIFELLWIGVLVRIKKAKNTMKTIG